MKYSFGWLLIALALATLCQADEESDNFLTSSQLLSQWRKQENKNDAGLRSALIEAAVRAQQPEIIEEVAAGGDAPKIEIKPPSDAKVIEIQALQYFEQKPTIYSSDRVDCVIRRMTKTRFEAWTPDHGWLFNATGHLVNEALPPRHDGIGREWHGAFLPDGRWVTTDLWEMDKTLTFFSRNGKWLREIKAQDLAPSDPDEIWSLDLIGWARCDRKGEGWVVSVGDGPGRARVFVKPHGAGRLLSDEDAPWKLCYPRDLEPKGMYTNLWRPSDDFKSHIRFAEPAHGARVGFPTYSWSQVPDSQKVIPDGDNNFGFLPGSHDVFIGASVNDRGDAGIPRHLKTWFFDSDGNCRGWVRAAYLTDSADKKETWYLDEENSVVTLGADLLVQSRMRFVFDGATATPVKLFTDLRLGFFRIDKRLTLAGW